MPTPPINNDAKSAELQAIELTDPAQVEFHAESLAQQINKFRMSYNPPRRVIDLSSWIADIIIETTAQGASLLEVHIIDPAWVLLMRDKNGVSFIDVDDEGYIWPPIEVNFPQDVSDATWRLCQLRPSTSLTEANLVLTFEDKIVSELREHYGALTSFPNETRAEFIQRLVKKANDKPLFPGEVDIRFKHLLPESTFTTADLTMSQRLPKSATQPFDARKHPNKEPSTKKKKSPVQQGVSSVAISIQDGWDAFLLGTGGVFGPQVHSPVPKITLPKFSGF